MVSYYVVDHPARRILVRRVRDDAVPERFDAKREEWIARDGLRRYIDGGRLDGADLVAEPISELEANRIIAEARP